MRNPANAGPRPDLDFRSRPSHYRRSDPIHGTQRLCREVVREILEFCDANITHTPIRLSKSTQDGIANANPTPVLQLFVAGLERRPGVGRGLPRSVHHFPRRDDADDAREHHRRFRNIPKVRAAAHALGLDPRATLRAMILSFSRGAHHRLVFPGHRNAVSDGADRARTGNP